MRRKLDKLSQNKTLATGLIAAIALALVGSGSAYIAMSKPVTLVVDGQERDLRTFADTVADLLESEDLTIGKRDEISPQPEDAPEAGARVSLDFARQVEIDIDGEVEKHWTTSQTVDAVLDELELNDTRSQVSLSRSARISREGASIDIVTPKKVILKQARKAPRTVNVAAETVADLLAQEGIRIAVRDKVKPGLEETLVDGMKVKVIRIKVRKKSVTEEIPAPVREREDPNQDKGSRKVTKEGTPGSQKVRYKLKYKNYRLAKRTVLRTEVTKKATATVVVVGTREAPAVAAGGPWDRIAQCESGGNWSINTGNGYYGGLQFSLPTWRAYGGTGYPHQHSRSEQIRIAERVRAARGGYQDWPHCGKLA